MTGRRISARKAPRSREDIERVFAKLEREHGDRIRRHNFLTQRVEEDTAELASLSGAIHEVQNENHDLDWEYFRRLQLDGVVPSLPMVADWQFRNAQEDDEDALDVDDPEVTDDDGEVDA